MGRRSAMLLAAAAAALAFALPVNAACPRLIMASGGSLAKPIVISDWGHACELYAAFFASAPVDVGLAGRPSIRLGLFWNGALWEPDVREGRLGDLRPEQADQSGRFYPAVGRKRALVVVPGYGEWPRAVNETGLRVLAAHGVAVRIADSRTTQTPWAQLIAVALAAVLAAGVGSRASKQRPWRARSAPPSCARGRRSASSGGGRSARAATSTRS